MQQTINDIHTICDKTKTRLDKLKRTMDEQTKLLLKISELLGGSDVAEGLTSELKGLKGDVLELARLRRVRAEKAKDEGYWSQ